MKEGESFNVDSDNKEIDYKDIMGRNAKVISGLHVGKEGRIRGFDLDCNILYLRANNSSKLFAVHESEVRVYI